MVRGLGGALAGRACRLFRGKSGHNRAKVRGPLLGPVALAISSLCMTAAAAAPPQRIVTEKPVESRAERVSTIAQTWAATATMQPQTGLQKHAPAFIGHFPGYRAAKSAAEQRMETLLKAAGRKTGGPSSAQLASTSAMVVFPGPGESDTTYIPPDSQIAAGPNDVVVAINALLAIYDKSGKLVNGMQPLSLFFGGLGVTGQIFDPRLLYDQADGRFVLSAADVDMTNFTSGDVLLAVSATSDPTGTWYKYAINFMGRNAANTANTFPDFPGLGLSPTAIYLTSNQFELNAQCIGGTQSEGCTFSDAWIKVIGLPALLVGNSTLSITSFKQVQTADAFPAFGIQPALSYGTPGAEFLVATDFSANPSTKLNLFSITTSGTPALTTADLTVPSMTIPPNAPQPSSNNLIITDDFRILNAVWSNGSLWCGQNVSGSSGPSVARWYQIALTDLTSPTVTQSGDVSGVGAAYYPELGVESDGTAAMTFTTSSPYVFASAAYTERLPTDPTGTMESYAVYFAGLGPYDEQVGNRWGDYSGLSLDPAGTSFWGFAEYAGTPDPNFGTEIAQITGPPALGVSPASIAFNQVLIGRVSPAQQVTVTNVSAASVTLGTATLAGPNAADFQLSADQCSGATLAAGASCTVSVASAPTLPTTETATLSFSAPTGEVVVGLSGFGYYAAILTASPSPLNFPNTPEQTASAPIGLTITNTGNIAATGLSVVLYGPFAETNTCGTSLGVGATCQIQVTFYPTSAGSLTGYLYLQSSAAYSTEVTLNGTGITAPAVTPCPASVNFGNQAQNTTSAAQMVTLTNTGSSALTISGITTSGDFAATNNCPASLNPRTSCAVSVTFTPTTLATETGSLQIADNAVGSPQSVPLTGTGVTAAIAARAKAAEAADAAMAARKQEVARAAGRVVRVERPLNFQPNIGQFPREVRYVAWTPEYEVGVTRDGLLLGVPRAEKREGMAAKEKNAAGETDWLRVRLEGANRLERAVAMDELLGKVNYLVGRNPRAWHTNVPTYARLRIASVYPGVDLVYHGSQRRLEYDFVVRPGANPAKIRLAFGGASKLRVTRAGDLVVETAGGAVRFRKPSVYQLPGVDALGKPRIFRRGAWEVTGQRTAAFRLGRYDRKETLVIDPVLSFSTYLGGTGADAAYGIAVGVHGNVYVAGVTHSTDFPVTTGAFQTTCVTAQNPCTAPYSANDGFVSKLSSDGSTLLYSTYLGGSLQTAIQAVAVDSSGNAYVTGFTAAADFPVTTGAFETQCPSPPNTTNGCMLPFVTKLNATGSALVYSTYLGGTPTGVSSLTPPGDKGTGIAVDSSGDAFIGGTTDSLNFPTTTSAFQAANPMAGQIHGFLSELNPAGSALVFSTYLGGTATDQVNGIALDSSGNVYATGWTTSANFPTTPGAFQTGFYGAAGLYITDAFIAKFSPTGTLVFSTLFAGSGGDMANAIAVDGNGAAYITGGVNPSTIQQDFPVTPGAWETTSTYASAFLAKLHPDGCALEYSTYAYFQQNNPPALNGITLGLDGSDDAYMGFNTTGLASPMVFPDELQPDMGAQMFLMEINPSGSAPLFTTPLGGSVLGQIGGMAVDAQGDVYVAGNTGANDFPAVNALQPLCAACQLTNPVMPPTNAIIAKISPATPSGIFLTRNSLTFPPSPISVASPTAQLVGVMNNQSVALNIQSVVVSGAGYTLPASTTPCSGSIAPGAGCIIAVLFDPTATGTQTGTVTLSDDGPGSPQQISLNGTGLADFSMTMSQISPGTLVAGTDSVSYYVTPNPAPGVTVLPGDIAFSCTNISPATCTFSPSTEVLSGGSVTLTVTGLSQLTSDNFNFDVVGTFNGQTVTLPVQIPFMDFSLGTSTNSASVVAGQSATYQLSVTPVNNWDLPISLGCSGLPSEAACSFSPASVSTFVQSPVPVTMTITTSAASLLPGSPGSGKPAGPEPIPLSVWLAAGILLLLLLLLARLRGRRMVAPAALVLLVALCVSCGGGGGSGGSPPPPSNPGTPSGTYSVTVTGSSSGLERSVKVSLTVN